MENMMKVRQHPSPSDTIFASGETLAETLEGLAQWLRENPDITRERGAFALTVSYPTVEERADGDTDVEVTMFLMPSVLQSFSGFSQAVLGAATGRQR